MNHNPPVNTGTPGTKTIYHCDITPKAQLEMFCCATATACAAANPNSVLSAPVVFAGCAVVLVTCTDFPSQIRVVSETTDSAITDRDARIITEQPGPSQRLADQGRERSEENPRRTLENRFDRRHVELGKKYGTL